jgi:hypothetical protein
MSGVGGAATTFAQLLAGPNSGSLVPSGATTTFRTGAAGGLTVLITDTLQNVALDAPIATLEVVAWDNSSGLYSTWATASTAWMEGLIVAGESGAFTVQSIGGNVNTPPYFAYPSFNLYSIPEPMSFALAGLGAAALLIFRRRK